MMIKNKLVFLFLFTLLTGCNSSKVFRILDEGAVTQKQFKTEIPFEMRLGLIILKPEINGKAYDFMLDTGAPNVVSLELAKELGLKSKGSNTTVDSQGQRKKSDFTVIDTINLNGIEFTNTGAAIMDFTLSTSISCMNIDGLIGANLMKNTIWQIDYEKQILTLTSSVDSLSFSEELITVPFKTKWTGTPVVDIMMDSNIIQKNLTLDSGSNGHINMINSTYKKLHENELIISHDYGYGYLNGGILGTGKIDTADLFTIKNLSFGGVHLENKVYSASRTISSSTIGTKFFRNYLITFNWETKELHLDPVSKYDRTKFENYGFKKHFTDGKVIVDYLYQNSSARKQGLQLGDHILQINDIDYRNFSKNDWCELIVYDSKKNKEPLTITVNRNGEELVFEIENTHILPY